MICAHALTLGTLLRQGRPGYDVLSLLASRPTWSQPTNLQTADPAATPFVTTGADA